MIHYQYSFLMYQEINQVVIVQIFFFDLKKEKKGKKKKGKKKKEKKGWEIFQILKVSTHSVIEKRRRNK